MRKAGKSYREIHAALRVPISTLSDWFSKKEWSLPMRERLTASANATNAIRMVALNKVRGQHLARAYEAAREEAREEFELLKYDPLFISGIMLYWGEGAKDPKQGVKFSGSDAKMIKFYMTFLTRSCRIPLNKIKANLLVYPELEERTARAYWSRVSGLPWEHFTRSTVLTGRDAKHRLGWGVCTVSVSSTYFKQKMLEWIRLLPDELLGKAYYENIESEADMV